MTPALQHKCLWSCWWSCWIQWTEVSLLMPRLLQEDQFCPSSLWSNPCLHCWWNGYFRWSQTTVNYVDSCCSMCCIISKCCIVFNEHCVPNEWGNHGNTKFQEPLAMTQLYIHTVEYVVFRLLYYLLEWRNFAECAEHTCQFCWSQRMLSILYNLERILTLVWDFTPSHRR